MTEKKETPVRRGFFEKGTAVEEPDSKQVLKRNILFNLLDGGFFGFGLGFASFSTILPLFVAQLTNSAVLIGLIPAIHNVGWQFPQLLTAKWLSKMDRYKKVVLLTTIHERLPFLGFAIIALLLPHLDKHLALVLTFALLVWQALGAGFTANGWQNLMSKIIPQDGLATFLGIQSALSNLLGGLSAFLAGLALSRMPQDFAYPSVFFAAFFCFILSWISLAQTKEATHTRPSLANTIESKPITVRAIFKKEKGFLSFLVSRFLSQFGMMGFAFYTIYAVEQLHMNTLTVGLMTSLLFITQTVANPILGRLADKWSRMGTMTIGGLCTVLSLVSALLIRSDGWLFAIPFILYGIANTAFWTVGMSITLNYGTIEEKPTYVGLANTLVAPATILAPLLGGVLADAFSYSTMFIVSLAFSIVAEIFLLALNFPHKTAGELQS